MSLKEWLRFRSSTVDLKKLVSSTNLQIPDHVAIIMDGNGRWAQARGLPRSAGHRAGMEKLREVVKICYELGIKILTLFAFSTENWYRPAEEVNALMTLLNDSMENEIREMHKNNIKVTFIGRLSAFPKEIQVKLEDGMELTRRNMGMRVNVALNYGGRMEIVDALRRVVEKIERGELASSQIDEETIAAHLYTAGLPDPDLLIRTGGEMRISNFLLWQIAYTELWVTPKYWPAFERKDLLEAIRAYSKRQRRFGRIES